MNKHTIDYVTISLLIIFGGILIIGLINLFREPRQTICIFSDIPLQTTIYTCSDTITLKDTIKVK